MSIKYEYHTEEYSQYADWAENHKTMICLNGGVLPDLQDLVYFFEDPNNPYAWATFNEDESLGNLLTSIAIVLPEKIYVTASLWKNKLITQDPQTGHFLPALTEDIEEVTETLHSFGKFNQFEQELVKRLGYYRLAH